MEMPIKILLALGFVFSLEFIVAKQIYCSLHTQKVISAGKQPKTVVLPVRPDIFQLSAPVVNGKTHVEIGFKKKDSTKVDRDKQPRSVRYSASYEASKGISSRLALRLNSKWKFFQAETDGKRLFYTVYDDFIGFYRQDILKEHFKEGQSDALLTQEMQAFKSLDLRCQVSEKEPDTWVKKAGPGSS